MVLRLSNRTVVAASTRPLDRRCSHLILLVLRTPLLITPRCCLTPQGPLTRRPASTHSSPTRQELKMWPPALRRFSPTPSASTTPPPASLPWLTTSGE